VGGAVDGRASLAVNSTAVERHSRSTQPCIPPGSLNRVSVNKRLVLGRQRRFSETSQEVILLFHIELLLAYCGI